VAQQHRESAPPTAPDGVAEESAARGRATE